MGMLIDGRWTEEVPPETGAGGEFRRIASAFRDRVTADGFLRVDDSLRQRFIVQLVEEDAAGHVGVRHVDLDDGNDAVVRVPASIKKATLVVSRATLGSVDAAGYRWEIQR